MIDEAEVNAAAVQAAKELRARARAEHGGNTQPLMVVYAVESFLRRLAESDYAGRMDFPRLGGRASVKTGLAHPRGSPILR